MISSLQELSILTFLLPFLLDAHAFLQTHPTLGLDSNWTFNLNLFRQIGMGGDGCWSQHLSSMGRICVCWLFEDKYEKLIMQPWIHEWWNKCQIVFKGLSVCWVNETNLGRLHLTWRVSSRNGFAWMRDARSWLNLEQNGSCYQLQTWTNSCFSLWNLVVEVALKGWIASTSEYETELIVKVNILHFYTSKRVSCCCWRCWCGVCIDLVLKNLLV